MGSVILNTWSGEDGPFVVKEETTELLPSANPPAAANCTCAVVVK